MHPNPAAPAVGHVTVTADFVFVLLFLPLGLLHRTSFRFWPWTEVRFVRVGCFQDRSGHRACASTSRRFEAGRRSARVPSQAGIYAWFKNYQPPSPGTSTADEFAACLFGQTMSLKNAPTRDALADRRASMTSGDNWLDKLSKLRVDRASGDPAPHKPLLLLIF